VRLLHGDSRAILADVEADSIDAVVTDAPYELGFMGKAWDRSGIAFDPEFWAAVLRVMKPGAYLLACGGTRTYHRMGSAIEDAGFEIRDCLAWLYGSGFPKSLNLGEGLGTALKPAYEPIVLARKPFKGTVAANVQQFGTGALNVDACRINPGEVVPGGGNGQAHNGGRFGAHVTNGSRPIVESHDFGRWPANVCLDDLAALVLDEQSGECPGMPVTTQRTGLSPKGYGLGVAPDDAAMSPGYGDTGGASRFFYVAKPSREERDFGCEDLPQRTGGQATGRADGSAGLTPRAGAGRTGGARNIHPTVKPVELMRWLVRLVTPPRGVVLDPFMGSGTTGMAAKYEQRRFIGIEREAEYLAIAERRIAAVTPLFSAPEPATTATVINKAAIETPDLFSGDAA
jgi:DNA modification methylase